MKLPGQRRVQPGLNLVTVDITVSMDGLNGRVPVGDGKMTAWSVPPRPDLSNHIPIVWDGFLTVRIRYLVIVPKPAEGPNKTGTLDYLRRHGHRDHHPHPHRHRITIRNRQ